MIILKILGLVFWLIAVPAAMGLLPCYFCKRDEIKGSVLLTGYLFMFFVLEVVGIPIVLFVTYSGYTIFVVAMAIVFIALASAGVVLTLKKGKKPISRIKEYSLESKIYLLLIAAGIVFSFVMVFRLASMDADDFVYNSYALSAQKFNNLYRIDPNTGRSTYLSVRHCLALIPMWQAFVSTLSGVHVAILVHKVLPLVIIPLSYSLIFKIGKVLFKDQEKQLLFVLLIMITRIFGNVSANTPETFFLLRTWQGKSMAGNLLIPGIIYVCLLIFKDAEENIKPDRSLWIFLTLLIGAGGATSSMAEVLLCGLTVMLAIIFAIYEKKAYLIKNALLCTIPGIIHVAIFVYLYVSQFALGRHV